jgi:hypothetical protein
MQQRHARLFEQQRRRVRVPLHTLLYPCIPCSSALLIK